MRSAGTWTWNVRLMLGLGLRHPGRSLSRRRDSRDKQAGRSHAIGAPGQAGVNVFGIEHEPVSNQWSFAWSSGVLGGQSYLFRTGIGDIIPYMPSLWGQCRNHGPI